jgi:exonuclease III
MNEYASIRNDPTEANTIYDETNHAWPDVDSDEEPDDPTIAYTITQPYLRTDYAGDPLNEDKPDNTTRLYFQNVNGVKWDKDGGTWPVICDMVTATQIDILCLSELNLDINQHHINSKMRQIERRFFAHSRFAGSTSPHKSVRSYKPGGTAMLVVEDTTAPIKTMSRDQMGRWVSTHLAIDQHSGITIITAYQVCQTHITGINTAANQQISQLISENNTQGNLNPRRAFIHDLTQTIQHHQSRGDHIILVGDFNDPTNEDHGITSLATECGLIDLFGARLGTTLAPNTYQRSQNRLDYALVSPHLLPTIKTAGYDPFGYRLASDHRGFYIDFDSQQLFSYQPSPLASIPKRDFHSKQPGVIHKYIVAATSHLESHNIEARLKDLLSLDHPNHRLAESIYTDLFAATKHASKKVKRKSLLPWSPTFSKAWSLLHYYKLGRSRLKNPRIDYDSAICAWQQRYPHLPPGFPTLA